MSKIDSLREMRESRYAKSLREATKRPVKRAPRVQTPEELEAIANKHRARLDEQLRRRR